MPNEPLEPLGAHEKTDPGLNLPLDPGTVALPPQARRILLDAVAAEADTQKMPTQNGPQSATTLRLPVQPALPEARPAEARGPELWKLEAAPAPRRGPWVAAGVIAVALIAAGAFFLYRGPRAAEPALASANSPEKEVPPALRQYYEQARTGDARAMRMLGTLYYNGLNVPQDRDEGIRWYRKAAAAGSVAARKDLEQLGLNTEQ